MAFDAERAARRLTHAGPAGYPRVEERRGPASALRPSQIEERASVGVADVVATATDGLATDASLQARFQELKADLAMARAEWKADLERIKVQLFVGIFAATGIILAAMRLWM